MHDHAADPGLLPLGRFATRFNRCLTYRPTSLPHAYAECTAVTLSTSLLGKAMENKVEDFVAGIEATFGQLARSPEELSGFLRAAESFYLDFIGASKPSTSTEATKSDTSELPFWRYLIFYTTLALDHAATASNAEAYSEDGEDDETSKAVASELSSCWPFLSVLVTQQYNALAHPSQLDLPLSSQSFMHGSLPEQGTSAEASSSASKADTALQTYNNHTTSPRPTMPRHPSVMRAWVS